MKLRTRMHSSRMRTARAFTVCQNLLPGGGVPAWSQGGGPAWSWVGCTWSGGVYLPGPRGVGVYLPGPGGVYPVLGGVPAWSRGGVPAWSWGVYLPGPGGWGGGVPGLGGVPAWSWGVYLVRYSPPLDRMTHAYENITLPQTSFAGSNNNKNGFCFLPEGEGGASFWGGVSQHALRQTSPTPVDRHTLVKT